MIDWHFIDVMWLFEMLTLAPVGMWGIVFNFLVEGSDLNLYYIMWWLVRKENQIRKFYRYIFIIISHQITICICLLFINFIYGPDLLDTKFKFSKGLVFMSFLILQFPEVFDPKFKLAYFTFQMQNLRQAIL